MSRNTTLDPRTRPHHEVPAEIDPRIAARREEVDQARSRKVRRRFLVVLVVLAIVAGAVALTRTPLLDVDRVDVRGNRVVSTADVAAASGVRNGDHLIGVDPSSVADRVESLPWVRSASVSRQWPGTVRITVTERRAVAVVGGRAGDRVLDASGRVLGPVAGDAGSLVRLSGDPTAALGEQVGAPWQSMLRVASRLSAQLRPTVAAIGTGEDGPVIVLTTGTAVRLCDVTDLDAKLGALLALVQRADPATAATIDLCVPGAPALTRKARGA